MEKILLFFGITPKWNAALWTKFWTTKLSAIQLALIAALATYNGLPEKFQGYFPDSFGYAIGFGLVIVSVLTPFAAAAAQPKITAAAVEAKKEG